VAFNEAGNSVATRAVPTETDTKGAPMSLLWIILIVVLVLALLGFFGRGRF
jgi:flagellar basal body-associated protein FliL